jgi:hypothetical protein
LFPSEVWAGEAATRTNRVPPGVAVGVGVGVGVAVAVTVTLKTQVEVFPDASVAVQVTGVVPTLNDDPDGGEQPAVAPGQLSLDVGDG